LSLATLAKRALHTATRRSFSYTCSHHNGDGGLLLPIQQLLRELVHRARTHAARRAAA